MIAVCDTSPIRYLKLIGEVELLPKLFDSIIIPTIVAEELQHASTPAPVREWAVAMPSWVNVQKAAGMYHTGLEGLHDGERSVIEAAEIFGSDVIVVLDERAARKVAIQRGLKVIGTVGLLARGAEVGLVDLPIAIERLATTNFRCSAAILRSMLKSEWP